MRVFLTGATGFIGKRVLQELRAEGHEVLVLIRPRQAAAGATGSAERAAPRLAALAAELGLKVDDSLVAVAGDLSQDDLGLSDGDRERVLKAEVIIHSGVPMDITLDPVTAHQHILQGTDRVVKLAEEIHLRSGLYRLVHVVGYMSPWHEGNVEMQADPYNMPHFLPRASSYERSKFLADLLVRQAARRAGFPLTVVNPSTVVGPRSTGETEQLGGFSILVDVVRRGLLPVIPGGKKFALPLVPVDEVARLTARVATWPDAAGQTYNLLDGDGPRMPELMQRLAEELAIRPARLAVPVSLLKASMRLGGSALTAAPPASMDFITDRQFSLEATEVAQSALGLGSMEVRSLLPFVIADLDHRLSVGTRQLPAELVRGRVGRLAALIRPGVGTPWVILHGLFSNADEMAPLTAALSEGPVWVLDLPGFGRSPLHTHRDPMQGHVSAVLAALAEIPGPVRLVGHSMGSIIAARVAAARPDLVASLHLLQPHLRRAKLPWFMRRVGLASQALRLLGRPRVARERLRSSFASPSEVPPGYMERLAAAMRSPRVRQAHAAAIHWLATAHTGIDLASLSVPLQLVGGTEDRSFPMAWAEAAVAAHPRLRLTRLPFGHQFPIAYPEETAKALMQKARSSGG